MGEAEEDCLGACSFSLMCQEDGADLFGGFTGDERDGEVVLLCGEAEEEEYMGHLVSKESSFCCSPSSSSSSLSSSAAGAESSSPSTMASDDWFRCARRDTVKWILETRGCFGFSHRTAYLAVAYFDRFCLHRCFDRSVMPWAARLLAVACVSLAAKMEEYRAPALSDFRADDGYDFSCVSIRRMELLVLSTLGWRMAAVTPFDYLPCLASRQRRRNGDGGDGGGALVAAKAAGLIFSAAEAASTLDYRPSTVAAAAVLAATHGALTKEALESKMSCLSRSCLLEKEDVYACYSLMLGENPPPPSSTTATNNASKRPSSCSDLIDAISTYDSANAADAASEAAASHNNKRMRLEPPGILR
ncbi:hypothetical protein ACP70R_024846 [Stipagrostis hirtigluma subsp. patula]